MGNLFFLSLFDICEQLNDYCNGGKCLYLITCLLKKNEDVRVHLFIYLFMAAFLKRSVSNLQIFWTDWLKFVFLIFIKKRMRNIYLGRYRVDTCSFPSFGIVFYWYKTRKKPIKRKTNQKKQNRTCRCLLSWY